MPAAIQCDPAQPEIPVATYAYRRARREELCAELSAQAYDDQPLAKPGFARFTSPVRTSDGQKVVLSAFGYVDDGIGYLSFRGTVPRILRNWLSDFDFAPTGTPRRHSGFENCWKGLRSQIQAWLENQGSCEIVLTGHSLGGAVAQLAAMELAAAWQIQAVVCFGAPLVGWRAFASAYDATPIHNRQGVKLGEVTTTYVFKSDLVRTLLSPLFGFRRNGEQIVIDEHGRMSDAFRPWYEDAASKGLAPLVWLNSLYGALTGDAVAAQPLDSRPIAGQLAGLPDLHRNGRVDWRDVGVAARPFVSALLPLAQQYIAIALAAVVAICVLITSFFSLKFIKRDVAYHPVRKRYLQAMTERIERWMPLAYDERGHDLLANKDPKSALTYLEAALAGYEREGRANGLSDSELCQYAAQQRLSCAAALIAAGGYPQAVVHLNALLGSYPQTKVEIPLSASAAFTLTPRVLALQQRAIAFQRNRQLAQAMADYAALLDIHPEMSFDEFSSLRATARRNAGAGGWARDKLSVFGYRRREVDAESDRLYKLSLQQAREALARLPAWAHYQRAVCAFDLKDFSTVILEATAAVESDERDAWAYHLRGVAHSKLQHSDDALADLSRSIELAPEVAGFWFARAIARLSPGSKVERDGEQAFVSLHLTRANLDLVESDLVTTLKLDPSHPTAKEWLENIRRAADEATPERSASGA